MFKASPYPDIAKGLIRYLMDPKNYNEFITGTAGRYLPTYPKLLDDPFWSSNKAFAGLVDIGRNGETIGREGVITAALGEVVAQSLLAKQVQTVLVNNVDPAEAVAKAHAEIVAIYKRFNEPVSRPRLRHAPAPPAGAPAPRHAREGPMLDLVITGGLVLDGTGAPAVPADVGVAGGRILEVGRLPGVLAARVIRADGRVVCPGFIDMHAHDDFNLPVNPLAAEKTRQGVTTLVTGNCGLSPAPLGTAHRQAVLDAVDTLDSGLAYDWKTFGAFLDRMPPLGLNAATLVGHGTVRAAVLGGEARAPRPDELERMVALVDEAMAAGAFGLSTGSSARRPGTRQPTRSSRWHGSPPGTAAPTTRTCATRACGSPRPSTRRSRSARRPVAPCRSRTSRSRASIAGGAPPRSSPRSPPPGPAACA